MGLSGSQERWASSRRSPGVRTRTANQRARGEPCQTSATHGNRTRTPWAVDTCHGASPSCFWEHLGVQLRLTTGPTSVQDPDGALSALKGR